MFDAVVALQSGYACDERIDCYGAWWKLLSDKSFETFDPLIQKRYILIFCGYLLYFFEDVLIAFTVFGSRVMDKHFMHGHFEGWQIGQLRKRKQCLQSDVNFPNDPCGFLCYLFC